ncbi:MAG: response regulator [Deltaproteobacteria bacterium]|nr:response regulator [Deltaproteobacteria bacterium]
MKTISDNDAEILLVEDSPLDAKIMLLQLEKAGYAERTLWVKSGEEAIDYLLGMGNYAMRNRQMNPKVIFLDLFLPEMSGFEVLQLLKMYDWTKSIPIIMLTNSAEETDMMDSFAKGVVSYIVKPLSQEGLARALAELERLWQPDHHLPV